MDLNLRTCVTPPHLGRLAAILALLGACLGATPPPPPVHPPTDIQVPSPPLTEGIFPCTNCHDGKTQKADPRRRPLTMHDEVALKHGPESRWCLDCHDLAQRDLLHLVSGERIPFTSSYLLCAQCHGDKYRDWRQGIHGKRTGRWDGEKQYLLCVHCHNPHAPRFPSVQPLPPPTRPEGIRLGKGGPR